ncbi:hypothetical protein F4778DRAFT_61991 [Xylariomycetidae sp. FL2044]|nr:hypothetical protein F4778DRAFT_61991 [Xylariomycetidae sp. FL2044]
MDEIDETAVLQISSGKGDGAGIVFDINGQPISLSIFPSCPSQHHAGSDQQSPSLQDHLVGLLTQATTEEDNDRYEGMLDEVFEVILEAGRPIFAEVAPRNKPVPLPADLDSQTLLYPKILPFRPEATGTKAIIVPINPGESYIRLEPNLRRDIDGAITIDTSLPHHSPKHIRVLETLVQGLGHAVSGVLVNNTEMLFKARGEGIRYSDLERELSSLQKIRTACLHQIHRPIRSPQLLGYVTGPESGILLGFLHEWVPGDTLRDASSSRPPEVRQKWASQISESVKQLHEIGVIWGDGKPSNVVIDKDNEAWLIDFGGGFAEGWVSEELAGTVAGDEQAVGNFLEFLSKGELPEDCITKTSHQP